MFLLLHSWEGVHAQWLTTHTSNWYPQVPGALRQGLWGECVVVFLLLNIRGRGHAPVADHRH